MYERSLFFNAEARRSGERGGEFSLLLFSAPPRLRDEMPGWSLSMNLKLKRTPGLYLLGFMASGKSTIGRLLADRLGWSFFDIDHEIETSENCSIAGIFDTRGEAEFRLIETQILRQHVQHIERGR